MKQEKTYKMVGFFVVIGFISFIAIIYNYLSYKFSTDESNYVVMYFDESIQGLNVGSPVMFKGVEIGKVAKIRLLTNIKEGTFKTPVYVSFEGKKALGSGTDGRLSAKIVFILSKVTNCGTAIEITNINLQNPFHFVPLRFIKSARINPPT